MILSSHYQMMDFMIQRNADQEEIRSALAAFYQTKKGFKPEPWIENENYHIITLAGDVALLLTMYESSEDELLLAQHLARALRTNLIISDDSINPYSWLLIDKEGKQHPIYQDATEQPESSFVVDSRHKYLLHLA